MRPAASNLWPMKTHIDLKLRRAVIRAKFRRAEAHRQAYVARTTRDYRCIEAAAMIGMAAETAHYEATAARRRATKH